jgi:HSP20 family protein
MNHLITKIDEMDRVFNSMWGNAPSASRNGDTDEPVTLRPRVDVYESEKDYVLEADLPGIRKDDLKVEVERNVLSIEGERKSEHGEDLHGVHIERAGNARFVRRFTLGREVDPDKIEARFSDGVLRLTVPKKEQALPRRINVA